MLPTCRGRTLSRSPKTAQPTPAQNGRHLEHRTSGPSQPPTPASIARQRRAQPRPHSHPPAPVHLLRRLQRRPSAPRSFTIFNFSSLPPTAQHIPPPLGGPRKPLRPTSNLSSPTPPPQSLPCASIHSAAPCRTGRDTPHLGQCLTPCGFGQPTHTQAPPENTYLGRSRRRFFAQPA